MLPGASPFKELAEALRRVAVNDVVDLATNLGNGSTTVADAAAAAVPANGSVLLVIDQFEELFTLTSVAEQAALPRRDRHRRQRSGAAGSMSWPRCEPTSTTGLWRFNESALWSVMRP